MNYICLGTINIFTKQKLALSAFLLIAIFNISATAQNLDTGDKSLDSQNYSNHISSSDIFMELLKNDSISLKVENPYSYNLKEKDIADFLKQKAINNFNIGNYSDAAGLFSNALLLYDEASDLDNQAFVNNFLATAYRKLGNYELSLNKYMEALSIYENLEDRYGMANVYNNIGVLFKETGDLDKAMSYSEKTLEITQKLDHKKGIAASYANIANIFDDKDQYKDALEYHRKALLIYENIDFKEGIAISYNNLASTLLEKGDYEKALDYSFRSYKLNLELNTTYSATLNVLNIASVFKKQKKYSKAMTWAKRGLDLAVEMEVPELIKKVYELLMEICVGMNNYKCAYENQKKFVTIKDSLKNNRLEERLNELELRYQTKKKESQINRQKNKITEQNLAINKRNFAISLIIGLSLLVLVIFSILFFRFRMRKQKELSEIYLKEEKKRTHDIINAVEKERKRIARDLHDGLGQKLASIKIKINEIAKKDKIQSEDFFDLINDVDETYKQTRDLSHQMIPKTLLYLGLADAIKDMADQVFHNTQITYQLETNTKSRFDQDTEIGLYRIFQELLNNIIKHSKADYVDISLLETSEQLMLIVEDNGIGFDQNKELNKGIGFLNINSRLKLLSGKIEINSTLDKGTSVIVRIPFLI